VKKYALALMTTMVTVSLTACEVEIADTNEKIQKPIKKPQFAAFNGQYEGRTGALSQGFSTTCDISLNITQSSKQLNIKSLEYDCDDGTVWGSDDSLVLELRKSKDRTQLAYDIYRNGTYVGFQNYSNNYALITLSELSGSVTIAISQSRSGVRLENYQVTNNDWVLFKPTAADLTKQ
jgi:hypothetical protein